MTHRGSQPANERRTGRQGQSLVELAISLPVVMLLLLGMLEFGFAFSHHLTLEYATREGARIGAALAKGTDEVDCVLSPGVDLDAYIIAAVQRVLTGTNGQIKIAQVKQIHIYKAVNLDGSETPGLVNVNVWVPGAGPSIDGVPLLFNRSGPTRWTPCSRNNTTGNTDSLAVSISYDYLYITPLGNIMGMTGTAQLHISDKTVMALNPSAP